MKVFLLFLGLFVCLSGRAQEGWEKLSIEGYPYALWFADSANGWMGGTSDHSNGWIRRTTDGGTTWVDEYPVTGSAINALAFANGMTGVAAGEDGVVLLTIDGGISWTHVPTGKSITISGLCFTPAQSIVACGYGGGGSSILVSSNLGSTWTETLLPLTPGLQAVAFASELTGWAAGVYAGHASTTDGGLTWKEVSPPVLDDRSFFDVVFVSPMQGFAAGGGRIAVTTDAGATWLQQWGDPLVGQVNDLSFVDGLTGWAAVQDRVLFTNNGGQSWGAKPWRPQFYLTLIAATDDKHAWAAGDNNLYRTRTGGVVGVEGEPDMPRGEPALIGNYPNPFNPSTTIRYALPRSSHVTLTVFNALGQQVATLVQGEQEAGYHEAQFDASDLASGVYLYRLQAGEFVQVRKLALLR
jgi:photosystem II stability/assembly factor-like uncharacterized protein